MENQTATALIDTVDNLNRYTAQARAAISSVTLALSHESENLSRETLANLVWLVGDRLDDIAKAIGQIKTK